MCRKRTAKGDITTLDEIPTGFGTGLPFVLEMIKAKVAGNDLDDSERHIISALYTGLSLARKRSGKGLPLDAPALELNTGL